MKVKAPVIPPVNSDKDIKTALNNLRAFFKEVTDNGGFITLQDLVDAKVMNKSGVKQ